MAWTTPETAVAGTTLTAAWLNQNVRDNTEYLKDETDTLTAQRGAVFIKEQSFSAVSSQIVSNCFSATYQTYEIVFSGLVGSTGNALRMQMRAGSTTETGNNYYSQELVGTGSSALAARSAAGPSFFLATHDANTRTALVCRLSSPAHATKTSLITMAQYEPTANQPQVYLIANTLNTTTVYDSMVLAAGAGTITGSVRVYGWAAS
jgi:hypothetical protein